MNVKEFLEKLNQFISFEDYRNEIEDFYSKQELDYLGYDVILLFKITLLQKFYSLSDEDVIFQISDWLSIRAFLGLSLDDPIPEKEIIYNFRKHLMKTGLFNVLFQKLTKKLEEEHNLKIQEGLIRDAYIVKKKKKNH